MKLTAEIVIDMRDKYINTIVDAVQYDKNSRIVKATLLSGGLPISLPVGATYRVNFKRADGSSGSYTELSDGSSAVNQSESNVLTIGIHELVSNTSGKSLISVTILDGGSEISTFSFILNVQKAVTESSDLNKKYPDTYDATATAANIQNGKTAYVNGEKITGTHVEGSGLDTSDATAGAGDILFGKTAYVNGGKITGSISSKAAASYTPGTADQTISAGQYLSGAQTLQGDANLLAENIRNGVSIFGVTGSYEGSSGGSSGRTLVSKSGTTQTASFDTGLSEIVAIVLKRSVDTTGLANASFVPLLATGTATGCSNYNEYMKNYATITSVSDYCNVEGGTFHWTTTNTTFRFADNKKYDWYAIGYE